MLAVLCSAAVFLSASCSRAICIPGSEEEFPLTGETGFYIENSGTKTEVSENGRSIVWNKGDRLYLWAADNATGELTLDAARFTVYAGSGTGRTYFTSALASPMPEGTYKYAACYPEPDSSEGSRVSFRVPAIQDGGIAGVDFMVSAPEEGGRLNPLKSVEDYSTLSMRLSHKMHLLRFFIPEDHEGAADGLSSFTVTLPQGAVGTYSCDLFNQEQEEYSPDGGRTIDMNLSEMLYPSPENSRSYAYAAVLPFSGSDGDRILFSANPINIKTDFNAINIGTRDFKAGHVTSVAVRPVIKDTRDFSIRLEDNLVGEPVRKLRLTGPEGLVWSGSGSNVIELAKGDTLAFDTVFTCRYRLSQELYDSLESDGSEILVEMISDHVNSKDRIALDRDNRDDFHLSAGVTAPYLLAENFDGVSDFSNHDAATNGYQGDAGNNFSVTFLDGWSGGRAGGSAGRCVRIAGRRESVLNRDTHYWARMDSAPLSEITSPVDIEVIFDYGTDEQGFVSRGSYTYVGQTFYVGYVQGTEVRASGSDEISGDSGFTTFDRDGSFDLTPNTMAVTIPQMEPGSENRITWRNNPGNKSEFGGNSTVWLYVDNVKVRVKRQ